VIFKPGAAVGHGRRTRVRSPMLEKLRWLFSRQAKQALAWLKTE
jgi:hypothetical protein